MPAATQAAEAIASPREKAARILVTARRKGDARRAAACRTAACECGRRFRNPARGQPSARCGGSAHGNARFRSRAKSSPRRSMTLISIEAMYVSMSWASACLCKGGAGTGLSTEAATCPYGATPIAKLKCSTHLATRISRSNC